MRLVDVMAACVAGVVAFVLTAALLGIASDRREDNRKAR